MWRKIINAAHTETTNIFMSITLSMCVCVQVVKLGHTEIAEIEGTEIAETPPSAIEQNASAIVEVIYVNISVYIYIITYIHM